ncbi:centromere protein M-like [Lineus longissimus]|uniref:centromere protein M-like n=1 Tax=Lineus longissimus TaxID=88925 RepID=UPI002B4E0E7A
MANSAAVLAPHRKLRDMHAVTILFVGSESINVNILAKAVMERSGKRYDKVNFNINCRTAVKLPLPADPDNKRPNIDYIVFLTDNNKDSFANMKRSLRYLDVEFFLGKMSLVLVSKPSDIESEVTMITEDNLHNLADTCRTTPLFVDLENAEDTKAVADILLYTIEIAAGFKQGVSSLLLMGSRRPYNRFEEL